MSTLSKAITVIGGDQVKSLCICSLLMNQLSSECAISAAHREILWKHSFAGSKIAAEITKQRPWMNRQEAAALGLFYDIGWWAMAMRYNEQFQAIYETAARRRIPPGASNGVRPFTLSTGQIHGHAMGFSGSIQGGDRIPSLSGKEQVFQDGGLVDLPGRCSLLASS